MSVTLILIAIILYFSALVGISYFTSRGAGTESYFTGDKVSPWYAVAFGMIGDSLSGVTFISVPGLVGVSGFSYFQLVLGYFVGYFVISYVLLPLYYKLNLVSIYSYLGNRFGKNAEKTGSFYFLLSRTLGAAGRLYLAANVLQYFLFDELGIPFFASVAFLILLMLVYTLKGGIKTLVWTDTFQSVFLLLGVFLSVFAILKVLNFDVATIVNVSKSSDITKLFHWNILEKTFFLKQFFGGIFIAIAMTGLDQNMMQKNLSCHNLQSAQKNMVSFSFVMLVVNFVFLSLGALLYAYADLKEIQLPRNESGVILTDSVFPTLAMRHLGTLAGLAFVIGLTAATFSSADSVLTTLTTSFYYDFLGLNKKMNIPDKRKSQLRHQIHATFAVILLICIIAFRFLNDKAIVDAILTIAGYTYGPLLGLFAFGIFTKRIVKDNVIPFISLIPPIICYLLNTLSNQLLYGYKIGHELLLINGILMFTILFLSSTSFKVNSDK